MYGLLFKWIAVSYCFPLSTLLYEGISSITQLLSIKHVFNPEHYFKTEDF